VDENPSLDNLQSEFGVNGIKTLLVVVTLRFLENYIEQAREKLDDLVSDIEYLEQVVQQDIQHAKLSLLITKSHFCNLELVKLERRWAFQIQLADSIRTVVSSSLTKKASTGNNNRQPVHNGKFSTPCVPPTI